MNGPKASEGWKHDGKGQRRGAKLGGRMFPANGLQLEDPRNLCRGQQLSGASGIEKDVLG
jgi:hypothetical protein